MFTIRKTVTLLALGAGIIATTAFPAGEADKAKTDAVGARHAQMQMVGYHTGILGGIAKGEIEYSSAMVDATAQKLAALAGMKHATL